MKFAGEQHRPRPGRAGLGRAARPGGAGAHHPGLRAAGGHRRERLRHDRHRGRRRDQGHLRRHLRAPDLQPHESLVMRLQGAGAPGTVGATVQVRFAEASDGTTQSPTTPTRSSAAWSAASASGCSPRCRGGWRASSSATSTTSSAVRRRRGSPPSRTAPPRPTERPWRGVYTDSRAGRAAPSTRGRLPQRHRRRRRPGPARGGRRRGLRPAPMTLHSHCVRGRSKDVPANHAPSRLSRLAGRCRPQRACLLGLRRRR